MAFRKVPLVKDEIYHVYSRSIAKYHIFNTSDDYRRVIEELAFYSIKEPPCKFSLFKKFKDKFESSFLDNSEKLVDIIAYCPMPTHLHLILKGLSEGGISRFMNRILQSYTMYFNKKHNRKGPLWESRFQNVLVETNDQFLHLTRYIHLNPCTDGLVDKPEDWQYSSYREYLGTVDKKEKICCLSDIFNMTPKAYKEFVNDRIGYQRELAKMKHLTLE